jgi:hypothetical protein
MSWDITIQDFPASAQSVSEIPNDYRPGPLGTRDEVIARIREVLPDVDFRDRSWGLFRGPGFTIEFNMGKDEICDGFMLHVRGGGSAIATVDRLLQHLKLRGIDPQAGDFFRADVARASFLHWQVARDQVIRKVMKRDGPPPAE